MASPVASPARGVTPKRRLERRGKVAAGACVALVGLVVVALIAMVAWRGLRTFVVDGISPVAFLTDTIWNPHANGGDGQPIMGALPMIAGSFAVTLLSCVISLPFAIGCAVFSTEVAPRFGQKVFRPVVEVLVGIPSVVFGLIGLTVVVPFMRSLVGGTGYGLLSSSLVLSLMILPTVTSLAADAVAAVPRSYREAALGVGCTRWQGVVHVILPAASSGIITAVVLGMARAFGEALAVQMVIGNAATMPSGLFTPAATVTSVLTMGMGNEVDGTVYADAMWTLALVLMVMSLAFILVVHLIGRKGETDRD